MKILFLTDEFYPDFGANSLVINSLCKELVAEGHTPYVMPFNYRTDSPKEELWQGIHICRLIAYEDKQAVKKELKNGNLLNALNIVWNILANKFKKNRDFRLKDRIAARKLLENFIKEENIDTVVSICCSVELSFPLLYLREHNRLNSRWILYMIDPFEDHAYYKKNNSEKILKKWQHRLMTAADRVVATDLIYEGMDRWESREILDKTLALNFPKIEKREIIPCEDDIELPDDCINVVCTGTRNEEERNSDFVLSVCKAIKSPEIRFHFIGRGWAKNEPVTDGCITYYPPCSYQAAINIQLKADFLLNIGNAVTNQVPSKVLEYICSGKPIIASYKSPKCPVLALLAEYDAFLFEENIGDYGSISILLESYIRCKHPRCTYKKIEAQYYEFTPKYCVEKFFESEVQ